ncbi:MAG: FAD-binding protein, partial [Anaerotignum sp.]|nr:FAD-binding protein [Anaerotignum sp.]
MEKFVMELQEKLGEEGLKLQEPMKEHTTFRVGGPADLFLMPKNAEELKESIEILKKQDVPMMVIGNGSNLLVRDKGIRGAVIQIYNRMANITVDGEIIEAQGGALLSAVAAKAADASLTGLEFASGIPGSIGGAVVMNAGAYGGEMKD